MGAGGLLRGAHGSVSVIVVNEKVCDRVGTGEERSVRSRRTSGVRCVGWRVEEEERILRGQQVCC